MLRLSKKAVCENGANYIDSFDFTEMVAIPPKLGQTEKCPLCPSPLFIEDGVESQKTYLLPSFQRCLWWPLDIVQR